VVVVVVAVLAGVRAVVVDVASLTGSATALSVVDVDVVVVAFSVVVVSTVVVGLLVFLRVVVV
jgi:hypothetical protein